MTTVIDSTASTHSLHVELNGLDYYARRRRLFTALRSLAPGQELELSSERADDVYFLRYEMEARMPQRYCWSAPLEGSDTTRVVVGLPRHHGPRRDVSGWQTREQTPRSGS